ncbi:hypothetical protein [Jiella avicenniae]|uniref:Lipoprotein n=1 Tax=Jiella avicenniae TaxID=2907202 RepID=A0A9X1T3Q1_9HYPH|nr:hypothetical protein [Jiella avicenniae]MCE7026769.1 hypothetical protein [Jiella avicenniae]
MKSLLILAAVAALSGCTSAATSTATSTAVRKPSTAEAECARFGFTPGTQPFDKCAADLRQQAQTLAAAQR